MGGWVREQGSGWMRGVGGRSPLQRKWGGLEGGGRAPPEKNQFSYLVIIRIGKCFKILHVTPASMFLASDICICVYIYIYIYLCNPVHNMHEARWNREKDDADFLSNIFPNVYVGLRSGTS